jgi:imidazolonepropionase-like amidohydrolase
LPPAKVIFGGTLIDGTGRPPIADALVVIEGGKVVLAGAAKELKSPENAQRTNASGLFITPIGMGARLEYGAPADLYLVQGNPLENPLILGNPMRVMKAGEWIDGAKR